MIDLHCHVLPGLDDGPDTEEEAVALAQAAAAAGTDTLVATPHVDYTHDVAPREIDAAVTRLRATLDTAQVDLELVSGAELSLVRLGDLDQGDVAASHLGEGPYLLIESPYTSSTVGGFEDRVFALRMQGQEIVLAHPERSPLFLGGRDRLARLVDAGVLCSVSTGSLAGQFGRAARRCAIELLRGGLVHNVASDAHDADRRPPDILRGFAALEDELPGISVHAEWFTQAAPAAILSGAPLPEPPELPHPRPSRLPWRRSW